MEGKKKTLEEEIRDCERKIKSFTTMLNDLQLQKENIETEIGLLKKQFGDGEITNEELAQKLEKLNRKMENIDEKIALREKQLEETKKELEEYKEKVEDAMEHLERTENKQQILRAENEELGKELSFKYKAFVSLGLQQELLIGMEKLMPTFNDEQKDVFENTFIGQNIHNLPQITTCAMYLMAGFVDLALAMGGASGGGGGGNNQGWRKKDDEDEEHWARRCMHGAARILNTPKRNIGKKR
jgi:anion-transporting  ArsA/GET3 family ATPase